MVKTRGLDLRKTHPSLYWAILIFAIMSVGLAVSYWFGPPPAFSPFNINRDLVAGIFFVYGVWQIVFLTAHHLLMVRIGLAFAGLLMGGWGFVNTIQAFAGNASFTLPIVFVAIASLHLKLLTEAPVNPFTRLDSS